MSRVEIWEALADAAEAASAAVEEYIRAPTPQAREASSAAASEYVTRLSPLIGQVKASEFETSLRSYHEAISRVAQLTATLNDQTG